jgi:transcriptional regulator with GAF, ATPase, and Fis domain
VKLLRLLEERTFERVGGTETLLADVRIVAATNRDLKQMVADGAFREDFYFRLNTFPVQMPPLRERQEDIPHLAAHFMDRMAAHLNKEIPRLPPEALAALRAYGWPGNVRELEHAIQHAVIVCRGPEVRVKDIVLDFERVDPTEEVVTLEEHERRYIQSVLEKTGWVIKGPHGAAALLRMPESTLRYRIKRLGIRRE